MWNFYEDLPELMEDWSPSEYFFDYFKELPEQWQPPFTWLFLGPAGTETRLHSDIWQTDAWLCNLQASERARGARRRGPFFLARLLL